LGKYVPKEIMVAAHIVPVYLKIELADYIFELSFEIYLFSIDNCL